MTSHDCVNRIRKIFKTKKVGHLGTLDPDVTGVLPLCINNATKIIQFINQESKEYIANISIGTSTTTEDSSGDVLERDLSDKEFTRKQIINVLQSFLGKQKQTPPMISAVKVNGKRLYEYARKNLEVKRPIRDIEIYDIELLSYEEIFTGKEVNFIIRVHCSKGTYIRTLAVDIGKKLGYPAHLKELIRTKSGNFSINKSYTFTQIEKGEYRLISLLDALNNFFKVQANDELKRKILTGQRLPNKYNDCKYIVFYDIFNDVLAIYKPLENNPQFIKPVRVIKNE